MMEAKTLVRLIARAFELGGLATLVYGIYLWLGVVAGVIAFGFLLLIISYSTDQVAKALDEVGKK